MHQGMSISVHNMDILEISALVKQYRHHRPSGRVLLLSLDVMPGAIMVSKGQMLQHM